MLKWFTPGHNQSQSITICRLRSKFNCRRCFWRGPGAFFDIFGKNLVNPEEDYCLWATCKKATNHTLMFFPPPGHIRASVLQWSKRWKFCHPWNPEDGDDIVGFPCRYTHQTVQGKGDIPLFLCVCYCFSLNFLPKALTVWTGPAAFPDLSCRKCL